MLKKPITRRQALKTAALSGTVLAMPNIISSANAAQTLVCADPGGAYSTAWGEAFYKPFEKETGIKVVSVPRRGNPSAEFKTQVETKNYTWDLSGGITADIADLLANNNLADELDLSGPDVAELPANMKNKHYLGNSVVTFVLAYRTDTFKSGLSSFADIWDLKKFPGRRGLRRNARDTIEIALRADGVKPGPEIYEVLSTPAGWDRAFRKLDEIKKDVAVWWSSSPQSTQLLQSGEVDVCPTFNARAQTATNAGKPVAINWNGGFYSLEGWVILKGAPKADLARKFVKYCARADRQAAFTRTLSNGPTNPNAYKHISDKIAMTLPTFPENFKQTVPLNGAFWGANKKKADERFNEWLLKG